MHTAAIAIWAIFKWINWSISHSVIIRMRWKYRADVLFTSFDYSEYWILPHIFAQHRNKWKIHIHIHLWFFSLCTIIRCMNQKIHHLILLRRNIYTYVYRFYVRYDPWSLVHNRRIETRNLRWNVKAIGKNGFFLRIWSNAMARHSTRCQRHTNTQKNAGNVFF